MVQDTESPAKRKASEVELPAKGEDPAERKRLLNVLAQRRYRQKRKAHVKALEEQVETVKTPSGTKVGHVPGSQPQHKDQSLQGSESQVNDLTAPDFINTTKAHYVPTTTEYDQAVNLEILSPNDNGAFDAIPITCSTPTQEAFTSFDPTLAGFPIWDPSVLLPSLPSTPSQSTASTLTTYSTPTTNTNSSPENTNWSLPTMPSSPNLDFNSQSPQPQQGDLPASSFPVTNPSVTSAMLLPAQSELSQIPPPHILQFAQQSHMTFADTSNFQILEQRILHAAMAIATRLHIDELIWDMSASSPFLDPSASLQSYTHLPPNLRPTAAQLTQPHHPIIDLLPWPRTRDRLIMVLNQPEAIRPKSARTPMALIEFVYDLEDTAEGVRIWGDDPYSDQSWEVGEQLFKSWWWAFDTPVIRRSNELKKLRGAKPLSMGSVLGEVD